MNLTHTPETLGSDLSAHCPGQARTTDAATCPHSPPLYKSGQCETPRTDGHSGLPRAHRGRVASIGGTPGRSTTAETGQRWPSASVSAPLDAVLPSNRPPASAVSVITDGVRVEQCPGCGGPGDGCAICAGDGVVITETRHAVTGFASKSREMPVIRTDEGQQSSAARERHSLRGRGDRDV